MWSRKTGDHLVLFRPRMKSLDWHLPELKRHFSGIETQTGDHNRPEKQLTYMGIQVIGGAAFLSGLAEHVLRLHEPQCKKQNHRRSRSATMVIQTNDLRVMSCFPTLYTFGHRVSRLRLAR
jgi:hypothetical protein